MRTLVLDTNVLLADPGSLLAFPDAAVIIPETVLGELDKLKTSRVDPDLRFRGREVSRILFELSEQGSLIDGVELPDGGTLRVVPLDTDLDMPETLSTRNADDRILAVALQACAKECDDGLTVVTNDLNMLLKAQALGLEVERHGDGIEGSFTRRFILRPFQRYKIPLGILALALAVFAAIVFLTLYGEDGRTPTTAVPTEFRNQLSPSEQTILDYLTRLEANETDLDTRLALANIYYDLRLQTGTLEYATLAIKHYEQYLEVRPDDADVRADMAAAYFYAGQTDRAIQEGLRVLEADSNHLQANFNLGIFYWRGRQDLAAAASQFEKVIELTQGGDENAQAVQREARAALDQLRTEAEEAGETLPEGGTL